MGLEFDAPILVVDDYREMARLVRRQLEDLGFTDIIQAQDGPTALALLRSRPIKLIISDYRMEPMSGLQLLQEVRVDSLLRELPFFMISGHGDEDAILQAKHSGVTAYLLKPFTRAALKAKLVSTFGSF